LIQLRRAAVALVDAIAARVRGRQGGAAGWIAGVACQPQHGDGVVWIARTSNPANQEDAAIGAGHHATVVTGFLEDRAGSWRILPNTASVPIESPEIGARRYDSALTRLGVERRGLGLVFGDGGAALVFNSQIVAPLCVSSIAGALIQLHGERQILQDEIIMIEKTCL
jgi:hypothetical protein